MAPRRPTRRRRAVWEACGNLVARPLLFSGLALLLSVLLLVAVVSESNAAADSERYADRLTASGYSTLYVDHSADASAEGLTTDVCARLSKIGGVHASMSLGEPIVARVFGPNGIDVPVQPVSAGVVRFLAETSALDISRSRAAQLFVDTAASFGAPASGQEFMVKYASGGTTNAVEAVTADLGIFGAGARSSSMLVTAWNGPAASCALLVDPARRATVVSSLDAALPAVRGFSHRWALSNADAFDSARTRFEARPSRLSWLAVALVFSVLWLFNLRSRRSDYAFYSVVGMRRSTLVLLSWAECAAVVSVAVVITAIVTVGAAQHDRVSTRFIEDGIRAGLRALLATVLIMLTWSAHLVRRTTAATLDALKDRS